MWQIERAPSAPAKITTDEQESKSRKCFAPGQSEKNLHLFGYVSGNLRAKLLKLGGGGAAFVPTQKNMQAHKKTKDPIPATHSVVLPGALNPSKRAGGTNVWGL